jgi:protein tyrosine/serine phosphatase
MTRTRTCFSFLNLVGNLWVIPPSVVSVSLYSQCFSDEAVNNDQAVLVHCKSGNSRGAMVCLGYLMHRFGW